MKRYLSFLLAPLFALMLATPAGAYEWLDETKVVPANVSDVPLWQAYRLTENGEASAWPVCREFLDDRDLLDRYSVRTCAEQVAELSALNYDEDMTRVTKEMVLWGPSPANTRADVVVRYDARDAGGDAVLVLDPEKLAELLGLADDVAATADGLASLEDEVGENAAAIEILGERADGHEAALADLRESLRTTDAKLEELGGLPEETARLTERFDDVGDRFSEFDRRLTTLENAPAPAAPAAEPAPEPADELENESAPPWWRNSLLWWGLFGIGVLILVIFAAMFIWRHVRGKKEDAEDQEVRPEEEPGPRASQADHDALVERVGGLESELGGHTTRLGELEGGHEKLGRRISAAQGMTTKAKKELIGRIGGLEKRVESVEDTIAVLFEIATDGARIVGGLPSNDDLTSLKPGSTYELKLTRAGSPDRVTLVIRRDEEDYKLLGLADREEVAFNGTFNGLRKILGRALRRDAQEPGAVIVGVQKDPVAA